MSTLPAVLTEKEISSLNEPQPLGVFDTAYGQYVADNYSPELAGRLEACGTMHRKYRDTPGHVWTKSYLCGKKSCPVCHQNISDKQIKKFSVLAQENFQTFTYLEISHTLGKLVRKIICAKKAQGKVLSKDGWRNNRQTSGILVLGVLSAQLELRLQAMDSNLVIETYPKAEFQRILERTLKTSLPPSFEGRLAMETKKQRDIVLQGFNRGERKKLSVESDSTHTDKNDPSTPSDTPLCPCCGSPAVFSTQKMAIGTPPQDWKWHKLCFKSEESFQEQP